MVSITFSQSAVIDHCSFKQQSSKNASVTDYEPQVMQISWWTASILEQPVTQTQTQHVTTS